MHSAAERGVASRRRRASPGKPESQRGKKEERGETWRRKNVVQSEEGDTKE